MIKLRYCLILIGIVLFLSATMTASTASDIFDKPTISSIEGKQVVIDGLNSDLYITLDKCLPNQLIENNLVIVIDASGSTAIGSPSLISLIDANAISIIRKINPNTNIGIVAFGGIIAKTNILSMKNETNKTYLENLIRTIVPQGGDNPTNLDQGLLAATELLNSTSGKKEIILFSDGNLMSDNKIYEILEKIVKDIINNDIELHFVQILSSNEEVHITPIYKKLAEVVGSQVIILNPDERIVLNFNQEPSLFESCSMKTNETNRITVTTSDGTPISGAEIRLDNITIGETTNGELSINLLRTGIHYFTANKPGYNKAVIKVVLPLENINATQMIKPNPINDSQLKTEVKETNESLNGFDWLGKSWFEIIFENIVTWFKLKS